MKARFFCANCGAEVPPKTERCPRCGKFFSAVTCPACGFQGEAELFLKGCPVCGYLAAAGKTARASRTRRKKRASRTFSPEFYLFAGIGLSTALVVLILLILLRSRF